MPTPPILSVNPLDGTVAWAGLAGVMAVLLIIDLLLMRGRGGTMSTKAAAVASVVWIALAFIFAGALAVIGTPDQASAFAAGYVVERSLSLDNVFVFLVVLEAFAIAENHRARILTWGILLALVLRLAFILIGTTALHYAAWLSIPFALILLWTGVRLWQNRHDHGSEADLVDGIRKRLRVSDGEHAGHFTIREGGRRVLTGAGAALLTIGVVDIIFAVDSVPAILAITTDTFIVFAANAFALLGLRPLFFLVADLVERLYYLKAALAVLLIFIAAKMGASEVVGKVPPAWSLLGITLILVVGVVASLVRERRQAQKPAVA